MGPRLCRPGNYSKPKYCKEYRLSTNDRKETRPWGPHARRIVIQVADYLGFDGNELPGGRQRLIRDIARVIRDEWGKEVLIVQKGKEDFEKTDKDGFRVIAIGSDTRARGDLAFARKARQILEDGDRLLYGSGEDAWPHFHQPAKAIQHGVWWDGPFPWWKRVVQRHRAMEMVRRTDAVLCVDTNFINWLRCQGPEGLALCRKCTYLPNYADTDKMGAISGEGHPANPIRILYARRFEKKRGPELFLQSLVYLHQMGVKSRATMLTIGGAETLKQLAAECGLQGSVKIVEEDLNGVYRHYQDVDIAVVPTLWSEGTSLAAVEAIVAGVPVVATPVGGLGNLVIPGFNGFLVTPSPQAIAEAIAALRNQERWAEMHRNCLSLRPSLSLANWSRNVLDWLRG